VRVRVALRSSDRRCVARAIVRVRGHRPVRTDGAGRARILATFHRRGRRRVTASKRGCRPGRAWLTVAGRTQRREPRFAG